MTFARFLIIGFVWFSLPGCFPVYEESAVLSFWTDKELGANDYHIVFVNDTYLGELENPSDDPQCGDVGLLHYEMLKSEDLHLVLYNNDGQSKEIGVVNLFSVSRGIKIKPNKDAEIFVQQTLDAECALVYLNW